MDIDHVHPETTPRSPIRRNGRLHSWMIAAIGVHFMLATVASASDMSIPAAERTKVRRISESVVQVLRELVDRHTTILEREPGQAGFRVIESSPKGIGHSVLAEPVRMLIAMLTDLPPPMRA